MLSDEPPDLQPAGCKGVRQSRQSSSVSLCCAHPRTAGPQAPSTAPCSGRSFPFAPGTHPAGPGEQQGPRWGDTDPGKKLLNLHHHVLEAGQLFCL